MRYQVRFVDDSALPVEWAFVTVAGEAYLFVRQSAVDVATGRCDALSRAWEVWQRVDPAIHVPEQRRAWLLQLEQAAS